jgi:hypothetical protein
MPSSLIVIRIRLVCGGERGEGRGERGERREERGEGRGERGERREKNFSISPSSPDPKTMPLLNNNKVYNAKSQLTVQCAGKTFTEAEFQKMGFDPKTQVGPMPGDAWIIEQGRKMLGF